MLLFIYRVDGGVSRNDYICQTIANVTSTTVVRMKNNNRTEVSCLGAAFMAGLSSGLYLVFKLNTFLFLLISISYLIILIIIKYL